MTGNLLQCDIDLARQLLQSGESDDCAIEALCMRRVNPIKARRAVHALREGVDIRADELEVPATAAITKVASTLQHLVTEPEQPRPRRKPGPKRHSWVWVGIVGTAAAIAGVLLFMNRQPRIHATSRELMSMPAPTLRPQTIAVQIEAGKVSLGGLELRRENAFGALCEILGTPSRTNQLDNLTLYAYDERGIVLYSSRGAENDSLVLYLEPMGGANGVQKAYSGTLTVQGRLIMATTDHKYIEAMPNLALKETITNVFAGDCSGLAISFAYLKSPDRLTLVQVDLK